MGWSGYAVAVELGCASRTVNDAGHAYGQGLVEDPNLVGTTEAVGLDEMLLVAEADGEAEAG